LKLKDFYVRIKKHLEDKHLFCIWLADQIQVENRLKPFYHAHSGEMAVIILDMIHLAFLCIRL